MGREERDAERLPILGELHGEVMVFERVAIREIGPRGVQIETAFPLHLDSLHDFRLTLGDQSVVVKGRIAHCSISDVEHEAVLYRSGVEFVEPSRRVQEALAAFVARLRDGRRSP